MCGICGDIHFGPEPVERDRIRRACATMRHRGPDHSGSWSDDGEAMSVALGAVRLAILDPTPAGNQPMHHASDRYHLVFNGEIYNYRALRRELASVGERFVTNGDTEVVLVACIRWGIGALDRLSGMWALAFYDSTAKSGFLSRDRFGIKPLVYGSDGRATPSNLCFASELQALCELGGWDQSIDPEALVQHLQFGYIAHPSTIYRGARRLPPGHYLTFKSSGFSEPTAYYRLPAGQNAEGHASYTEMRGGTYGEICGELRRRLSDSIVSHRVSDVPIGAFLSGGVDSSIIVADLASATGRAVKTFSVGYTDAGGYDETRYARIVADRFGTDHHELLLSHDDVLRAIPSILDHLGEPVGDSSIIVTSLVSRFAAGYVTVALSGDGGDELFGGYWRYLGHRALQTYRRLPASARRLLIEPVLTRLASAKSSGLTNRIRQFRKLLRATGHDPLASHIAWSRIMAPEAEVVLADRESAGDCEARVLELAGSLTADLPADDWLNRILAFDLQYSLPSDMLQKVDLASMMHSLEVRVPFLDPQVVEFATGLPSGLKIDRGRRKRVLLDAYRGVLPDEILGRSKMGFEVPVGEYLRGPLRELFHDTVTRGSLEAIGLVSYDGVERVYEDHLHRRGEHAEVLFALLTLCWWHRNRGHDTLTCPDFDGHRGLSKA